MNSINIKLKPKDKLNLPISYNHIIQGMVYNLLSIDEVYAEGLHDIGFTLGKRDYKLFTFGRLLGNKEVKDKRVIFSGDVELEIRSLDSEFIMLLTSALKINGGVRIGNVWCDVDDITLVRKEFWRNQAHIKMITPVIVTSTTDDGRTIYYSPYDTEFAERLRDNFIRKFYAACDEPPPSDIDIQVKYVTDRHKCITTFKGTYITGWNGEYILSGDSRCIEFLYYTGLGSKNSQGFGMFKV